MVPVVADRQRRSVRRTTKKMASRDHDRWGGGWTYAEARLITGTPNDLVSVGRAVVSPDDPDIPDR
jgi:hypothetical protein